VVQHDWQHQRQASVRRVPAQQLSSMLRLAEREQEQGIMR
jgi:hypothetical protein